MSIKVMIVLAAAIDLSSAIAAVAQAPYYYDYYDPESVGGATFRSLAAPPSPSDYPAAAGGGSVGYNANLKRDDW
jgi:hypothetical protein